MNTVCRISLGNHYIRSKSQSGFVGMSCKKMLFIKYPLHNAFKNKNSCVRMIDNKACQSLGGTSALSTKYALYNPYEQFSIVSNHCIMHTMLCVPYESLINLQRILKGLTI